MSKSSKLSTAIKAYNVSECVRDFDWNIMPSSCLPEDLEIWAAREVFTVSDLEAWLNYYQGYSDSYKEINGFRPRFDYSGYTLSAWFEIYDAMKDDAERLAKWEAEQLEGDVYSFKKAVKKIQQSGAKDFMTAIRWMMDADDCNPRNRMEVQTFFHDHKILHSEYAQTLMNRVCPPRNRR